jgi:hypothetical protein
MPGTTPFLGLTTYKQQMPPLFLYMRTMIKFQAAEEHKT